MSRFRFEGPTLDREFALDEIRSEPEALDIACAIGADVLERLGEGRGIHVTRCGSHLLVSGIWWYDGAKPEDRWQVTRVS